jgi:NAD-dependent SIR2 family protein deacetylase
MKPHAMFFDESYNEHYYRGRTTDDKVLDIDALIVIGTALATSGARRLVYTTLDKMNIPVIEVNNNPCI